MNRAQRRRAARRQDQAAAGARQAARKAAGFSTEVLMTCFALALRRLFGFGQARILRCLEYVDVRMGDVSDGRVTVDELRRELEDETGVRVKG